MEGNKTAHCCSDKRIALDMVASAVLLSILGIIICKTVGSSLLDTTLIPTLWLGHQIFFFQRIRSMNQKLKALEAVSRPHPEPPHTD